MREFIICMLPVTVFYSNSYFQIFNIAVEKTKHNKFTINFHDKYYANVKTLIQLKLIFMINIC